MTTRPLSERPTPQLGILVDRHCRSNRMTRAKFARQVWPSLDGEAGTRKLRRVLMGKRPDVKHVEAICGALGIDGAILYAQ